MKTNGVVVLIFGALMFGCANSDNAPRQSKLARITLYSKGEDKYGNRIASSRTRRATVGKTIAAESRMFPFGTRIHIPRLRGIIGDGTYVVEDRGSAVEKRKASYGTTPVLDIFAGTKERMKQWARKVPAYLPFETL